MKGAQKAKSKGSMSPKGGAKKKTRQCMVEIEIDPSDTIETVKAKICQTGGLTFDQEQRLIFDGMEVMDHKRVRQYSIAPGDVVHLIRKER
ncbi:ubiquitin domain containing protein [Acanthamoeba castellanii str. Neff]|uniref:Ubiquitin domain containing protein n=1 Tax=Acanthamoeba castellanii (strain ATCC 30010 / Neff) TaxID=1257118 RepID=L8GXI8_ACACF|nr:ubiquitin domain containing protein [Acanthamoeba castellanii str. Neff]ELR17700.1 ubiquitin domain containing protein [Acanthamoeba castellanii str. Neff]